MPKGLLAAIGCGGAEEEVAHLPEIIKDESEPLDCGCTKGVQDKGKKDDGGNKEKVTQKGADEDVAKKATDSKKSKKSEESQKLPALMAAPAATSASSIRIAKLPLAAVPTVLRTVEHAAVGAVTGRQALEVGAVPDDEAARATQRYVHTVSQDIFGAMCTQCADRDLVKQTLAIISAVA